MLYCFTKTTDWGKWLEIKETLALEIKDIVQTAGSSFAFPSQSLYLEALPGKAEIFPVPGDNSAP
jgi:MscS family membrane protein